MPRVAGMLQASVISSGNIDLRLYAPETDRVYGVQQSLRLVLLSIIYTELH